jgi:hypothetical protein
MHDDRKFNTMLKSLNSLRSLQMHDIRKYQGGRKECKKYIHVTTFLPTFYFGFVLNPSGAKGAQG